MGQANYSLNTLGIPISTNETTENEKCMGAPHIIISIILSVMIIGVVIGNSLVVLSVGIYERMQTFTNILLVSLASADLLVGTVILPPAMIYLLKNDWPFSHFFCRIWATSDVLLCTASILSLCVISLDRYFAISYPLAYIRKRNKGTAVALILGVWLLSVFVCIPPWFNIPTWGFEPDPHRCGYVPELSYRIYSASGSFFLPLIVMLYVYYRILQVTTSREKMLNFNRGEAGSRMMKMHRGGPKRGKATSIHSTLDSAASALAISGIPGKHTALELHRTFQRPSISCVPPEDDASMVMDSQIDSVIEPSDTSRSHSPEPNATIRKLTVVPTLAQNARKYYERTVPISLIQKANEYYKEHRHTKSSKERSIYWKERKALKTIGIVVSGFVVCWFPFFLSYVLESACPNYCIPPPQFQAFILWLGYSNSILNPMIYAWYNHDFRRCFRDLLTCGCWRSKDKRRPSVRRLHQSRI